MGVGQDLVYSASTAERKMRLFDIVRRKTAWKKD